jgi:hypothetical protein
MRQFPANAVRALDRTVAATIGFFADHCEANILEQFADVQSQASHRPVRTTASGGPDDGQG